VLALTVDGEMYTWGRTSLKEMDTERNRYKRWLPKEIEIYENTYKQRIIMIE
jgi:hypothetical protein